LPRHRFFGKTTNVAKSRRKKMALTRDFKETIQARVKSDPKYRRSLFIEAMELYLSGDVETSNTILRDYINATVGFEKLGKATHKSPKSLMRMFSQKGNPQARNFFDVLAYLQKKEGLHLKLSPVHT
jgi:DNA-binding phage protein